MLYLLLRFMHYIKKNIYTIIKIVLAFVIIFSFIYFYDDIMPNNPIVIVSSEKTIVTSVLEQNIDPSKNYIYSSTMQIAWNKLTNEYFKETIEIEDKPQYVDKLNEHLNESPNVSEDSYTALLSINDNDALKKINIDLAKRFNSNLITPINSNGIVAYSSIYKEFSFKNKFESFKSKFKFSSNEIEIKSFGIEKYDDTEYQKKLADQIFVHYYDHDKPGHKYFIFELKTNSLEDSIIISNFKPEETLLKSFEFINSKIINNKDKEQYGVDSLVVPKMNFNVIHRYYDLINKKIKNKKHNELSISDAISNINFKIDESGIKFSSFFEMILLANSPRLNVNGPFIIYLIDKKSKTPYFMAYIGNDELLLKK